MQVTLTSNMTYNLFALQFSRLLGQRDQVMFVSFKIYVID